MTDPLLLALLPLAGVAVTVLAGLFGAWIQGRREHSRWIQETRYHAYVTFLQMIEQDVWRIRRGEGLPTDNAHFDELRARGAEVSLLGTRKVVHKLNHYTRAFTTYEGDPKQIIRATDNLRYELTTSMRKALRVPYGARSLRLQYRVMRARLDPKWRAEQAAKRGLRLDKTDADEPDENLDMNALNSHAEGPKTAVLRSKDNAPDGSGS